MEVNFCLHAQCAESEVGHVWYFLEMVNASLATNRNNCSKLLKSMKLFGTLRPKDKNTSGFDSDP